MLKHILKLLVDATVLIALTYIMPSLYIENFWIAVLAAIVIALVNLFIKPIVLLLTLPINVITLGLFTFIVNAAMFALSAWFIQGFEVGGLTSALIASILFSLLSFALTSVLGLNKDKKEEKEKEVQPAPAQ